MLIQPESLITSNQIALIMATQENVRQMLYKELCDLIEWNKEFHIMWNWIFKRDQTELEKKWLIDWMKSKHKYATIPELEDLIEKENATKNRDNKKVEVPKDKSLILPITVYLQALGMDSELLSSYSLATKAIESTQELNNMRKEHIDKYGTLIEKTMAYLQLK